MSEKIFPTILIILDFFAAVPYAVKGDFIFNLAIKDKKMVDALVQKFIDEGKSVSTAYRMARRISKKEEAENFDYEKETPKGEWV